MEGKSASGSFFPEMFHENEQYLLKNAFYMAAG